MTGHDQLRAYGRFLDDVQGSIDIDLLLRNAAVSPAGLGGERRRRRVLAAVAAAAAVIAIPILFALFTDEPTDPAEQPSPEDPNLGYDDLAPPTSRPALLDDGELAAAGFVITEARGCAPDNTTVLLRVSPDGVVVWETAVPWMPAGPSVAGDRVVGFTLGQRPALISVDLATGQPQWQRFVDEAGSSEISVSESVLILPRALRGAETQAYDVQTGELLWTRPSEQWGRLGVIAGALVASDVTGVTRLDPSDGSAIWHRPYADSEEVTIDIQDGDRHRSGVPDDVLLVRAWPDVVERLHPETGDLMWRWESLVEATAVLLYDVIDGAVVFETNFTSSSGRSRPSILDTDRIGALDVDTGEVRFLIQATDDRHYGAGFWIMRPDWIETGTEVVELRGGVVDATTGELVGPVEVDPEWEDQFAANVGGGGYLVVTSYDGDTGITEAALIEPATGEEVWRPTPAAEAIPLVVEVGGTLFLTTSTDRGQHDDGGVLHALDPVTLVERWRLVLDEPVLTAPVLLDDGDILVTASGAELFCD